MDWTSDRLDAEVVAKVGVAGSAEGVTGAEVGVAVAAEVVAKVVESAEAGSVGCVRI